MTTVEVVGSSLAENERVIERNLSSFVETGRALMAIRDERQYIAAGFDTFEDYCRQRWDLGRSAADQTISSVRVVDAITTRVGIDPPQFEFHARPLTKILNERGEDAVAETWQNIIQESDEPVTASRIRRFIETGSSSHPPAWAERLGEASDLMTRAEKQVRIVEDEIQAKGRRQLAQHLRERAARYAAQAQDLADRLKELSA